MALEGLRILDFTRLGFGAQATLICGCLGAEVIRVESTRFPDAIRVMPPFVPEPGERGEAFGAATLANATGAPSPNRGGIFYKYNTGGKTQHHRQRPPSQGPGTAQGPRGRSPTS